MKTMGIILCRPLFAGIVNKGIPMDSLTIIADLKAYPIFYFNYTLEIFNGKFNGIPDTGVYEFTVQ